MLAMPPAAITVLAKKAKKVKVLLKNEKIMPLQDPSCMAIKPLTIQVTGPQRVPTKVHNP